MEDIAQNRLHIMLFEDYVKDPISSLQEVFTFLNVDSTVIPVNATLKTNQSFRPKNETLFHYYRKFSLSKPRMWIETWLPEFVRPIARNQVRRFLGTSEQMPKLKSETKARLQEYFEPEIQRMEDILKRDLSIWREA